MSKVSLLVNCFVNKVVIVVALMVACYLQLQFQPSSEGGEGSRCTSKASASTCPRPVGKRFNPWNLCPHDGSNLGKVKRTSENRTKFVVRIWDIRAVRFVSSFGFHFFSPS